MDKNQLISLYRLISELFLHPEDRAADLARTGPASLAGMPETVAAPLQAFFAAPNSFSTAEYVPTLELAPLVPLYVGAHLYDEPASCRSAGMSDRNGYMLELNNIYRHFGVEFEGREMADFVPVVIEFLGLSLEREDRDQIGLRRYLFETKLFDGFEILLAALHKCESPYAFLVEALTPALAIDIQRMSGGPIWRPPTDVGPELSPPADYGTPDHLVFENGVEQ